MSSPGVAHERSAPREIAGSIFVVDDDAALGESVVDTLSLAGYRGRSFTSADTALAATSSTLVDLLLVDVRMPEHDGFWLLEQMQARAPEVGVVMMTGFGDPKMAVRSMKQGALDYLSKPFDGDELTMAVESAIQKRRLLRENSRYRVLLEKRTSQLQAALGSVTQMFHCSMKMLVRALDWRERETKNHSCRVALSAAAIAREMGLDGDTLQAILIGGFLHDIGKIGVPDSVLLKAGPLDREEMEWIRRHPEMGCDILASTAFLSTARDIVLYHHERYDGQGYPYGLSGSDIPLPARIFAVVDTIDAITNNRPYRAAQPFSVAREEIIRCSGSQFDPDIAAVCAKIREDEWDRIREHDDDDLWHDLDSTFSPEAIGDLMLVTYAI
ncbi:MAG TPA: HD domain-containing phosphohydrolase [Armatimonadota bacterium]|nr:HD domain-containing phosphohydrolase [Armatimonadota bacterium]